MPLATPGGYVHTPGLCSGLPQTSTCSAWRLQDVPPKRRAGFPTASLFVRAACHHPGLLHNGEPDRSPKKIRKGARGHIGHPVRMVAGLDLACRLRLGHGPFSDDPQRRAQGVRRRPATTAVLFSSRIVTSLALGPHNCFKLARGPTDAKLNMRLSAICLSAFLHWMAAHGPVTVPSRTSPNTPASPYPTSEPHPSARSAFSLFSCLMWSFITNAFLFP